MFVVDDHADVREGLRQLVETVGMRCEAFASAKEFLERGRMNGPSCIVLDIRLPSMSGLELQAELNRRSITIPLIMITGYGDIPMSVRAMKAGAIEFFTKPVPEQELLDTIHAAIEKDRVRFDTELKLRELRERYDSLTDRERQILPLVTEGLLNKQIAAEVGLSEVTVKVHRRNMMAKIQAKSVPALVRMAKALNIRTNGSGQAS